MPQIFERRAFPRLRISRACKVFRPNTQRYLAARTSDVSAYGALLHVDTPRLLQPGEELQIAVAWHDQPVLAGESLVLAHVVRLGQPSLSDGGQTVAVKFSAPVREAAHLAAVA